MDLLSSSHGLTWTCVNQACSDDGGKDPGREFRSLCCHSCKLQILPARQASKGLKGQPLEGHANSNLLNPALMPPYIQEQGSQNSEAASKTYTACRQQESASLATVADSAASNRDHMRAYLADCLLLAD